MGPTGNPDIPLAKCIVDYLFRRPGMRFIPGFREANGPARPEVVGPEPIDLTTPTADLVAAGLAATAATTKPANSRDAQFARFQSDSPACDVCGAITVCNGNCYLFHKCGASLGCS